MNSTVSETTAPDLPELSRKTGLLFEHRQQYFISRARVGCRLENDQLSVTQTLLDLFRRRAELGPFVVTILPRADADRST